MKCAIAIDFGGTSIKLALVKGEEILATEEIPVENSDLLAPLLEVIEEKVESLALEIGVNHSDFLGVGMAFPSLVDSRDMKIVSRYVKYTDVNQLDLQKWVSDLWNIPLLMENDARAALVGEWQFGAGVGKTDLVQITIGTGVGSSAMMDGRILRGKHFMGGNLGGHMTIKVDGELCNCGNIGCLETVASTWALPSIVRTKKEFNTSRLKTEAKIDFEAVFRLAGEGDSLALKIRDESIRNWAFGLVNMVHAFDPEMIIVGGGIMKSRELIIPHFQEIVDKHTWIPAGSVEITHARNGNLAALLGMGYMVEHKD